MSQENYKTISSDFNSDVKHIWIQGILKSVNISLILKTYILIWYPHVQKHKHPYYEGYLRTLLTKPFHNILFCQFVVPK